MEAPADRQGVNGSSPALAVNAQMVVGLELRATVQFASRRADLAAGFLQLAADVASRNHPGWFVSPALEELVDQLGALLDADVAGVDPHGPIVHVLAGDAGELIHDARRWWRLDPDARLLALPDRTDNLLAAADELRHQMGGGSLVVLHGSGAALSPLLALAGWARRPPAVFVEPSVLGFWAGIGVLDAVVHATPAAAALAAERRCLPTGRSVVLEPEERDQSHELLATLHEIRHRVVNWPSPRPPTAMLPMAPTMIDQRVLAQQVEGGLSDGIAGALRRWVIPAEVTARPGWIVLSRDSDRTLRIIRDLLTTPEEALPDVVVVDVIGGDDLARHAAELAGVVELVLPGRELQLDDATELGVRQLVSDELLVLTDGVPLVGAMIRELQRQLRAGAPAVGVGGLPAGERCEMRRHPRLVGWAEAAAVETARLATAPSGARGTDVRDSTDITENRGKVFHTESEAPGGPSDSEP